MSRMATPRSRTQMIHRLQVKNYKSLRDLDVQLPRFAALVGPNNSGKTNIFLALNVLRSLAANVPLGQSLGAYELTVWRGSRLPWPPIEFVVDLAMTVDKVERRFRYHVAIEGRAPVPDQLVEPVLAKEEITDLESKRSFLKLANGGGAYFDEEEGKETSYTPGALHSGLAHLVDRRRNRTIMALRDRLLATSFYAFFPNAMRFSAPAARATDLVMDGSNFAPFLLTLKTESDRFPFFEEVVHSALKEVTAIRPQVSNQGQVFLTVREDEFDIAFHASELSEGVLKLMGLAALATSPSPPAVACIEEPENYLHPRSYELIAEVLRGASERFQVLFTTHSPTLIDRLRPEDLLIVTKVAGETQVRRVEDPAQVREGLKDFTLGELYYSGGLEPPVTD